MQVLSFLPAVHLISKAGFVVCAAATGDTSFLVGDGEVDDLGDGVREDCFPRDGHGMGGVGMGGVITPIRFERTASLRKLRRPWGDTSSLGETFSSIRRCATLLTGDIETEFVQRGILCLGGVSEFPFCITRGGEEDLGGDWLREGGETVLTNAVLAMAGASGVGHKPRFGTGRCTAGDSNFQAPRSTSASLPFCRCFTDITLLPLLSCLVVILSSSSRKRVSACTRGGGPVSLSSSESNTRDWALGTWPPRCVAWGIGASREGQVTTSYTPGTSTRRTSSIYVGALHYIRAAGKTCTLKHFGGKSE